MDAPERRHVLLGQSFIGQVLSAQLDEITVIFFRNCLAFSHRVPEETPKATLAQSYEGFDDLKNEDHDGDADEEDVCRFCNRSLVVS